MGKSSSPGPARRHLPHSLGIALLLLTYASAPNQLASQNQPDTEANAVIQRGEQLNNEGKYNEAIVEFRKVVDRDSHNSHALFRMAEAQGKLGNLNAALNTLKEAVEGDLQPKWIEVWSYINIARIYDIRGQRYRATPMYHKAVDTGDDSFSAQAEAKKCLDQACEGRVLTWPAP